LGLGGLESLYGIPGSVGGAVRMNAGAGGSSMGEAVTRVAIMRLVGGEVELKELKQEELGFSYRHSGIGEGKSFSGPPCAARRRCSRPEVAPRGGDGMAEREPTLEAAFRGQRLPQSPGATAES